MIETLLDQMTLEEQVSLLSGADFWTTNAVERLGIPKIKVTDGPNGARGGGSFFGGVKSACFPAAISLGSSWDEALLYETGVALAEETRTKSARVLLAPTVNIHRSGLNGRNFECYSEDPHLTSRLAVAYIKGVQSQGIAATIKHFAGNESEIERQTMSSDIDERSLREIYLPPFEAAVKEAGVMAVMSAYNRLNGTHASENPWLLTEVLRKDWGFDGIVMSDWFGSHTTAETVNAGLDLEMPGPTRDRGDKLVAAVREGKVSAETIRECAYRMLRLLERVGAFVDPSMGPEQAVDRPEHRALIRKLGAAGAVLLKNTGILPLEKVDIDRIAVLGPNAAQARVMGGGSAQINAHYAVNPLEGIRNALSGTNRVSYLPASQNNRLTKMFHGKLTVEFFAGRDWQGPAKATESGEISQFFWLDPPHPDVNPTNMSARVAASFKVEETGDHVFGLTNAGLARLYVDGKLVVDGTSNWEKGENFFGLGNNERRGTIHLEAGRTADIRVDFQSMDSAFEGIDIRALRFGVEVPLGDKALDDAVAEAASCDIAVVFAGRDGEWDTEGNDLPNMRLPGRQDELIARVAAVNPRAIVVLQTGGPVEMPWLGEVQAVLQVWYPGQELGNAIADLLFGEAEPGGRLPQSFPVALRDNSAITDTALTYPGVNGHVRYDEGVYVGYRHHDKAGIKPLFPFGFGLSYTRFDWSTPRLSAAVIGEDGVSVEVDVTNTGARRGSDVVQLYVRPLNAGIDRPEKELRAFAKLELAPGETGTARLTLSLREFSYFDVAGRCFLSPAGDYELLIAANAADIRSRLTVTLKDVWREPVRP